MTINVMTRAVEMMLEKFDKVVVIQAEGNHDLASSVWLRKHIKHVFSKNPRLEVIDNDFPFYATPARPDDVGIPSRAQGQGGQLTKDFQFGAALSCRCGARPSSVTYTPGTCITSEWLRTLGLSSNNTLRSPVEMPIPQDSGM